MAQNMVQAAPARLLSLDVFRGITVAAMILVNNPGDWGHIYSPLRHARWDGCTPTDLVFPFFLFIVGVSIVYALSGKKADPTTHGKTILRIVKRSLIIFGIGIFLALFADFDFVNLRIPGVLQRIAVVFLFSSIIFLKTSTRVQLFLMAFILLLYWGLMTLVPVPGIGQPNLEPSTNLGAWLDNKLLPGHLWASSKIWDPEGILSTLPAIVTGLSGGLGGKWLRQPTEAAHKTTGLLLYGNLAMLAGLAWNLVFPINKALWTSSYVLYTAGLAAIGLGICYWFIDVKGHRFGIKPFAAFGMNAITVYVIAGLLPDIFNMIQVTGPAGKSMGLWRYLNEILFVPYFNPENASLLAALLFVLICFIPIWIMYQRRIIIKI